MIVSSFSYIIFFYQSSLDLPLYAKSNPDLQRIVRYSCLQALITSISLHVLEAFVTMEFHKLDLIHLLVLQGYSFEFLQRKEKQDLIVIMAKYTQTVEVWQVSRDVAVFT